MRGIILLLGMVLFSVSIKSQTYFPDKCAGIWQGMMHIYQSGSLRDSVPVRFTVQKLDSLSWTWKMEYLSEKRPMVKDYILRLKDASRGVFVTDEGDGIELSDHVFGEKMFSVFDVSGLLLTASYELTAGKLIFEVTSGPKPEASDKEVRNYPVLSLQRAEMKKMN
jgi:hypothetical protein